MADLLTEMHAGWPIRIEIGRSWYPSGADLLRVVSELEETIEPDELEQR